MEPRRNSLRLRSKNDVNKAYPYSVEETRASVLAAIRPSKKLWKHCDNNSDKKPSKSEIDNAWVRVSAKCFVPVPICKLEFGKVKKAMRARINNAIKVKGSASSWEDVQKFLNSGNRAQSQIWTNYPWLVREVFKAIIEYRQTSGKRQNQIDESSADLTFDGHRTNNLSHEFSVNETGNSFNDSDRTVITDNGRKTSVGSTAKKRKSSTQNKKKKKNKKDQFSVITPAVANAGGTAFEGDEMPAPATMFDVKVSTENIALRESWIDAGPPLCYNNRTNDATTANTNQIFNCQPSNIVDPEKLHTFQCMVYMYYVNKLGFFNAETVQKAMEAIFKV